MLHTEKPTIATAKESDKKNKHNHIQKERHATCSS